MIVNMSVATDGCHSLTPITSTSSSATPTNIVTEFPMPPTTISHQQGHTTDAMNSGDFNFLKRKLDSPAQQQQTANLMEDYHTDTSTWKKRHVDNDLTHNFGVNSFVDVLTTSTTTANHSTTDIAFTNTSAFINDLFTYDANLIVPVSASLVSHTAIHTEPPAMSTAAGICLNSVTYGEANDEDGTNWQTTDLLELDHRYNSGLHTEINELNPTIVLKPAQEDNLRAAEQQHIQQEQHHQQQQQNVVSYNQTQEQQHQQADFNGPQKQMTRLQNPSYPSGKYRQPQNDNETDQFEDKNLSWLLNFKFDEFPHLSPDVGASTNPRNSDKNSPSSLTTLSTTHKSQNSPNSSSTSSSSSTTTSSPSHNQNERSRSPKSAGTSSMASSSKVGKKFEELVMEVTSELDGTETAAVENINTDDSLVKAPKKPPFTYTELIEYALEDKGELTVSGIYQWISDRFPYYKSNDDRWKNSVRHNLSINPHFRKGLKAPQGAGHLWTISSGDSAENVLAWEHKKQRLDLFFKMESMNRERLQQHKLQQQQQQQQQQKAQQTTNCQHDQLYDEAATAAATITQEMSQQPSIVSQQQQQQTLTPISENSHHHHHHHEDPHMGGHFHDMLNDDELRKTAGQILNGIHREVEVQSVNSIISTYQDVLLDNDFLNPINKDINLMHSQSSHVPSSHYYVTEIDPLELGIQMSHHVSGVEEEVLFNDEFNLNYFYNPGNDIVA